MSFNIELLLFIYAFKVSVFISRIYFYIVNLNIPGKTAPGFGIGALEELDAEDEDVYASG